MKNNNFSYFVESQKIFSKMFKSFEIIIDLR